MIPELRIEEYDYPLPEDRIAKYPLPLRDSSKLLQYKKGNISEYIFRDLPDLLPENALMVFNDTKVVPARLHFQKETGALIEIFCLEPVLPSEYSLVFASTGVCRWKCILGNVKKWKSGLLEVYNPEQDKNISGLHLEANLVERGDRASIVEFRWEGDIPFSKVLEICGSIPIPPYLRRETEEVDKERYQTLYAHYRGSVAAPTAGLHFTDEVLNAIAAKDIKTENICLHVGAGTFLPVKSSYVSQHEMHREPFTVGRNLLLSLRDGDCPVVAVGTTSVRTLESLYFAGVECIEKGHPGEIGQWEPYEKDYNWSLAEALDALIGYMDASGMETFTDGTRIIIVPGYRFRVVDALVTNFHQPQSTLLLLISAFLGGNWKPVYNYALNHNFRFLSYGDSSLLFGEHFLW